MSLRAISIVAALLVCIPATALAAGGPGELTSILQAKDPQRASKLETVVECPQERCHVTLHGNAKADGEKFKLRPRDRTLPAEEKERFGLEIRNRRQLEALLADGDGTATIRLRAVDAEGVIAKAKLRLTLTG